MPKKMDNTDAPKPPITQTRDDFVELKGPDGFSKRGVFTDKRTGEKFKRNYPAIQSMLGSEKKGFTLNPDAYTVLNRGDKKNKAVDPFYGGNVKGDRMVAKLTALNSAKDAVAKGLKREGSITTASVARKKAANIANIEKAMKREGSLVSNTRAAVADALKREGSIKMKRGK